MRIDGPGHGEQDGAAWGDERQVAVWGQVSARTVILYAIAWSLAADRSFGSWPSAVPTIVGAALGYGFASRFSGAWDRRKALRSQEETADDALNAPDPIR